MTQGQHQRTQYIVYRHVRFYYLSVWALSIIFVILTGVLLLLMFTTDANQIREFLMSPEASYLYYGAVAAIFFLIAFAMAIGLHSIINSHRIAGAAYAIQAALHRMVNKDLTREVALRKKDFLQELAGPVNVIMQRQREQEAARKIIVTDLEKLRGIVEGQDVAQHKDAIKDLTYELELKVEKL